MVCILGANPPLSIAEGFIRRIWKDFSIDEIKFSKPGQYVVRFHSEDSSDEAISRTYYQFDKKPVYVRKWKPGCTIDLNVLNDIPIWAQLPDLELKYWSLSGLSKIGSLLGKPIRTDNATATKTKMEYARMQVAVAMNQQFPDKILFADENKRLITQKIKCEWCPVTYTHCKGLRHTQNTCRRKDGQSKQRLTWKPKHLQKDQGVVKKTQDKEGVVEETMVPSSNGKGLKGQLSLSRQGGDQRGSSAIRQVGDQGETTTNKQEGYHSNGFVEVKRKKAFKGSLTVANDKVRYHDILLHRELFETPYKGHLPFLL
ncbi:unnamed protein product [Cuscuta campestris]|uniref:DUF4283 domain-containing protein n=1 Tax=Cuscuta campestris TaxID=132261 RepID=A0A484K9J2_9ASTE|nr:unnamed protein product [Cuscuta campestris]